MISMGATRKLNTRNKILNIIRALKNASKFQIQKISKYSMTTILSTIDELQSNGLIIPAGKALSNGGRCPEYFTINPKGSYFIGIEFDALVIHGVILNFAGEVVASSRFLIDSAQISPELMMDRIIAVIEELIAPFKSARPRIIGIGVGAPGLIDYENGIGITCNDIKQWHNIAVKQILESHFGLRTYVDNNANTVALAYKGLNKHQNNDFVLFSIRKGIRISCITNNTLLRGRNNSAGEVGHVPILAHGRTCVCGRKGCLDAEASNDAIRNKILRDIQNGRYLDLYESVGCDSSLIGIAAFVDSVLAGHPESIELLDEICELLSIGLTYAVNFFNPPNIIIYGELTKIGLPFLERVKNHIDRMAVRINSDHLTIELAKQNDEVGAAGAATMVIQNEFSFVDSSI